MRQTHFLLSFKRLQETELLKCHICNISFIIFVSTIFNYNRYRYWRGVNHTYIDRDAVGLFSHATEQKLLITFNSHTRYKCQKISRQDFATCSWSERPEGQLVTRRDRKWQACLWAAAQRACAVMQPSTTAVVRCRTNESAIDGTGSLA